MTPAARIGVQNDVPRSEGKQRSGDGKPTTAQPLSRGSVLSLNPLSAVRDTLEPTPPNGRVSILASSFASTRLREPTVVIVRSHGVWQHATLSCMTNSSRRKHKVTCNPRDASPEADNGCDTERKLCLPVLHLQASTWSMTSDHVYSRQRAMRTDGRTATAVKPGPNEPHRCDVIHMLCMDVVLMVPLHKGAAVKQ